MRRSRIKPISDKRKEQIILEKELAQRLYKKQKGLCARCDKPLGWRSAKHEQVFRSRGGSAIDEANCELLCGSCHSRFHGIIEPDPVTYWE